MKTHSTSLTIYGVSKNCTLCALPRILVITIQLLTTSPRNLTTSMKTSTWSHKYGTQNACYHWSPVLLLWKNWKKFEKTNSEFVESCHSSLRKSEEKHNFKIARRLGSPVHIEKSLQSLTLFDSMRVGESTPLWLRRKSSSHLSSPHLTI